MKRIIQLLMAVFVFSSLCSGAETKKELTNIQEFDLENGLHVIISTDKSSPVVCVGMMYHVGSKNENPERTGFAHLFEHLLFYGTKNIPQNEMDPLIRSVGGYSNASTTADRTYYYTILPSNQYRLGLWIESERMFHPMITQEGIDKEKEVVKEESRQRYDGTPLGRVSEDMLGLEYKTTPYHWPVIGSMDHLDAATVTDFKEFFAKYYVPNNACLILTGNVNVQDAKQYIDAYFQRIPRGDDVIQPKLTDKPSGKEEIVEKTIKGLKEPHMMISYVTVPQNQRDAKVLEFLLAYLQQSDSPLLALENDKKNGISRIRASAELYELAGSVWFRTSYNDSVDYREVLNKIDLEFIKLSKGLSQKEFIRLKAAYESGYSDLFFDTKFLSESLGLYHFFWGDAQKLNGVINEYLSITNDEIIAVVNTYFVHGNRKIIVYHPEKEKK